MSSSKSFLTKYFGLFQESRIEQEVSILNQTIVSNQIITYWVLMKNVLKNDTKIVYDIKGDSKRIQSNQLNKEPDFEKDNRTLIFNGLNHLLHFWIQLKSDLNFLASFQIMDYSLLIGFNQREFTIGIIDAFTPFSLKKVCQFIFKTLLTPFVIVGVDSRKLVYLQIGTKRDY